MKKYLVFIISFILFYTLVAFTVQLLSGIFLTSAYIPNINEAWNASAILPQETEVVSRGIPFLVTLLLAVLSATFAYFITQQYSRLTYR